MRDCAVSSVRQRGERCRLNKKIRCVPVLAAGSWVLDFFAEGSPAAAAIPFKPMSEGKHAKRER